MKKFVCGALLSFISLCGYAYGQETIADPIQKQVFDKDCHHRGPRGFRGHRGHTGPRGHRGKQGIPGPLSTVFDRAFLNSPVEAITINPSDLPMTVPVNPTDLSSSFFNPSLNAFVVPEGGVYRIDYFLRALPVDSQMGGTSDTGGLVMGIVIDGDTLNPLGLRTLPLSRTFTSLQKAPSRLAGVWGAHQIFVRLIQGQTVQLAVLAAPNVDGTAIVLDFVQTGDNTNEMAYLGIEKVAP